MAKYNYEFKKQMVDAYLGEEDGLFLSRKNENYFFEFKLHVVELLKIKNTFLKELRRLHLEDEAKMRALQESSTVSEGNSDSLLSKRK